MRKWILIGLVLCTAAAGLAVWQLLGFGSGDADSPAEVSRGSVNRMSLPGASDTGATTAVRDSAAANRPSDDRNSETIADNSAPARAVATSASAPTPSSTRDLHQSSPAQAQQRIPAPGVMERIATAETYLQSLLGELTSPMAEEERERIQRDAAFRDWMVELESKIGNDIDEKSRREIRARQIYSLDLRNRLQQAYLSGSLDWTSYLAGMRAVSLWSDKPYQQLLTQDQYQRLNGFDKGELGAATEAVWEPPEAIEAVNFFPQIRASNPDITTQDLYRTIPQAQLARLTEIRKSQLLQELKMSAALDSGELDQSAFLGTLQQHEADLMNQAKLTLSPEGFQLLFPEANEQGEPQ